MNTATCESVLKAWAKATKKLTKDKKMLACCASAGLLRHPAKRSTGFQVFVKVSRYDEALLRDQPLTGGLLENAG